MSATTSPIDDFLALGPWAVVGASRDRGKYGNRVLRTYLRHGLDVHAVNPHETEIEGRPCYPDLAHVPVPVRGVSVITPPAVTERIVEEAAAVGARFVWMQPGAESAGAIARGRALGLTVIAGGPCVLVELAERG